MSKKNEIRKKKNEIRKKKNITMFMENGKMIILDDHLEEAKVLLKLVSKDRLLDEYQWYELGQCLHNINDELLEDWIILSKKAKNKNMETQCRKSWRKMEFTNYSISTLHDFALKDSPIEYLKMKDIKINKLMDEGLEPSSYIIAKLLMEKYKFIYKCASIKYNIWYEFKNHRWIEIDSAYTLRNLISNILVKEYTEKRRYLYELSKTKNGYDRESCGIEANQITKIITKLNNSSFKNGIVRECGTMVYDPVFREKLDENTNLLCFNNGVYDLGKNIFRAGTPDDCIGICTNYNYIPYDKNNDLYNDIKIFMRKIQPNKIIRNYLMTLLSTCLVGETMHEELYILTSDGYGSSGMNTLINLMRYTLGDLFKAFDENKKGARMCILDNDTNINYEDIKYTSSDVITTSSNESVHFKPQFKLFLLYDALPIIKIADDDVIWSKLHVIPLLNTEYTNGIIFTWKEVFMCILIRYYQKYRLNGLTVPKSIDQYTMKFRDKCDIYGNFIKDFLKKTGKDKDIVHFTTIYAGMKEWWTINHTGKCPKSSNVKNYLSRKISLYDSRKNVIRQHQVK